jgi:hypothetical protein
MHLALTADSLIAIVAVAIALVSLLISTRQAKLFPNPVIGIRVVRAKISDKLRIGPEPESYRQALNVEVELSNLGAGPAIAVIGDATVSLSQAVEAMPTEIAQRFDPEYQAYLRPGETTTMTFAFGHLGVAAVIADLRTTEEMNLSRIEKNPSQEAFNGPCFEITIFYKSNLGLLYQSRFSAYFSVREHIGHFIGIPDRDENLDLSMHYIPRPVFSTGIIRPRRMDAVLACNNSRRRLSGW